MVSRTASESQSIYRFWANPQVSAQAMIESHRNEVVRRAQACATVLAIQDTTDLDFTSHPHTSGLGFINQTKQQGIKVHNCFAVSGKAEPLGLLHQVGWNRKQRSGKSKRRRKLAIKNKESYRWLKTATTVEQVLSEHPHVVHVADREADIFELFARPRAANTDLLIRAEHNRKVEHELGYLKPTLAQAPVLGQCSIEINRNPERQARIAQLEVRALAVSVMVPVNHPQPHDLNPVNLNVIWVKELEAPADGGKAIDWLLVTSLAIETFEQTWQCVQWYSYRWLIERFHFTLKSGCRIEELQLQSKERLLKALATYSVVAWRVMWLAYRARLTPDASCELVLQPAEWKLLRRKYQPKSRSSKPPTLQQAVVWVARLGGFLARKGDGQPGLKTIWRGLSRLRDLQEGARLASKS